MREAWPALTSVTIISGYNNLESQQPISKTSCIAAAGSDPIPPWLAARVKARNIFISDRNLDGLKPTTQDFR
jgi:hypothetical protein